MTSTLRATDTIELTAEFLSARLDGAEQLTIVLFPGQGPDPRIVHDVDDVASHAFEKCVGISLAQAKSLDSEDAYRGQIAQPLHIIRLYAMARSLDQLLTSQNKSPLFERPDNVIIPASLTEFLLNSLVKAWKLETSVDEAHKRGLFSDNFALANPGVFGMGATFLHDIRKNAGLKTLVQGHEPPVPIVERMRDILGPEDYDNRHQLYSNVFIGSRPSPGMATLTGSKDEIQEIGNKLRVHKSLIGFTYLNRIDGVPYHSPQSQPIQDQMKQNPPTEKTGEPDLTCGIVISPTSRRPLLTSNDVKDNRLDLIVLPVNQLDILHSLRLAISCSSSIKRIVGLEIGNVADYPWGKQQGVQTAAIHDYSRFFRFTNKKGQYVPIFSLAYDGSPEARGSVATAEFINQFL